MFGATCTKCLMAPVLPLGTGWRVRSQNTVHEKKIMPAYLYK